jgi:hypothetical protein
MYYIIVSFQDWYDSHSNGENNYSGLCVALTLGEAEETVLGKLKSGVAYCLVYEYAFDIQESVFEYCLDRNGKLLKKHLYPNYGINIPI